ncbi:class I adenylate-forming enzyme family protein [Aeromicrobium choanae]|uniref:Crotonobetaine/carnitine-CoA ligase n=1 Tax=Aeromicrobium choanae TaxID=1736691 RepID=A0A1T4YUI0_9ACTN|nr:AMP-binding protein [Aeromicrobium choanae]SKB05376.1 crotonobetaine/carnitine-CoA ligase [Aeromicrobium choanae]
MGDTVTAAELEELLECDFATAVDALDHHVAATGDRRAIVYGETGETLTYAELGRTTDHVAGNLVALGVEPGSRVSILTTHPLVSTLAMYGLWKAGAVYAPVNFQYAGDLLAYQLNDTRPTALLVDRAMHQRILDIEDRLECSPQVIVIDGLHEGEFGKLVQPAERPDVRVEFDDPANVIYTSGTTGPSKGVVQSHRWVNGYTWVARTMMTPEDVVYNDLPMYHVGGAHFNVVRALWTGASVSLWDRFSPNDFWRRITETGCTTAVLLDVMTPWLLNAEPREEDRRNPLNKVHLQPLPANHHEFAERFGIDFVTSGFGQSESGNPLVTLTEQTEPGEGTPADLYRGLPHDRLREIFEEHGLLVLRGTDPMPKGIMGKPTPFLEVAILDDRDRVCPDGVVGQLAMRPRVPSLIHEEYLAKPEATVKAWRNLWFHTGDAAVRDEDGVFAYIDRMGDRIRVRGENISGFHIEEMLLKHPSLALAAVIAVPSADGDEDDVIAFVEVADGHTFDRAAIEQHCLDTMPKFMRPRDVIPVGQIPRTPTNKIEKYKLRQQWNEGQAS